VLKTMYIRIFCPWFYGCVMWTLILKEEHKLQVFQSVKKIFGPNRNERIKKIMQQGTSF
jgi:hypothetical protein